MQLTSKFTALAATIVAAAVVGVSATPAPVAMPQTKTDTVTVSTNATNANSSVKIMSHAEMMHWIATTDAELTFIGEPINPLSPRSAQITTVTYCSNRVGSVCGGPCTVYTGGATCLRAPDTNCLMATQNIGFCASTNCNNPCTQLTDCILELSNGFCWTPNTSSITVPP